MVNDVQTNSSVSVSTAVYTEDVLHCAQRIVSGRFADEYYFFQYAANDYVLLVGDISFVGLGCVTGDIEVYEFVTSPVSSTQSINIPFSGSQSGQYGGSDGAGGFSGSVSGNSTISIQTDTRYNVTYAYTANVSNVTITNNSYLVYGSAPTLPHLVEGVENYAFAAFALALGVISFKLVDRIFRRVY